MDTALRISSACLKAEQQEMVRIAENHGLNRNTLADGMCVTRNLIDLLMSEATTTRLTTEHDLFLRSVCAELGHYEFVERLLGERAYVTRRPQIDLNDTTVDEILDGVVALGQTREAERANNWWAIRNHGAAVKQAGIRIELEALNRLGVDPSDPVMAQSAPLFETA